MKKICLAALSLLFSAALYAQQEVTKFLGIPVDGTKAEMIQKLKAKGFRGSSFDNEVLEGEFNGREVKLHVVTNNNRVYRVAVIDANGVDESEIKVRFNTLCQQFKNNSKYLSYDDYTIPDDEKISYQMLIKNKRYKALFYQKPTDMFSSIDTIVLEEKVQRKLLSKYTKEELENPTKDIMQEKATLSIMSVLEELGKRLVGFMISELYGKYYITIYYDNKYNEANGEDL